MAVIGPVKAYVVVCHVPDLMLSLRHEGEAVSELAHHVKAAGLYPPGSWRLTALDSLVVLLFS
jgi:hypothetical protein